LSTLQVKLVEQSSGVAVVYQASVDVAANQEINSFYFDKFNMHAVCGACLHRVGWVYAVFSAVHKALVVKTYLATLFSVLDSHEALTVSLREVVGE
jgi:hypothetical protein